MSEGMAPQTALAGLKVLDISRILAGPWATQIMADLGADVVKVESPNSGDDTRTWGPPFISTSEGDRSDAAYFACCNRNKRSITIDFSKEEGQALVLELAEKADVIVENFKLGGLVKYGLDYESICKVNPNIIYCSVTGFGQSGPYAHRPGYDFLIQGMGGLMSITGHGDGVAGAGPMKVGVAVCDLFTGMYAATSVLAALNYRNMTGQGQHIDCSLLDSQVAMLANQASNWLNGNMIPDRLGNNHPNVVPYRVYKSLDGFVIISCGNDSQFVRLCAALGIGEMAEDPRFAKNENRIENRSLVDSTIEEITATVSSSDLIQKLEAVGVPCGPINSLPDVFSDPHVRARGMKIDMVGDDGTQYETVAYPAMMSKTPAIYRMAPPRLGAHTETVIKEWLEAPEHVLDRMKVRS